MDTNTIVQTVPTMVSIQQILINVFLGVATAIGTTLIPFLISWIRSKLAKEHSGTMMTVYDEVSQIVLDTVQEAQETIVSGAKSATADGKLSKEEAAKIKDNVINKTKTLLSHRTMQMIGKEGQNINDLISTMIEARLAEVKRADKAAVNIGA